MNKMELFTELEGNMLIRILLAHLLADFVLQTDGMVKNKKWFSGYMGLHIAIVYIFTAILTNLWLGSIILAFIHYLIDGAKIEIRKRYEWKEIYLFIADQVLHFLTIIILWATYYNLFNEIIKAGKLPFTTYNLSLILLGYVFITAPLGYAIGILTQNLQNNAEENSDKNGFRIGVFERLIILTFVLLGEYEAIGFLITGKSIIRFGAQDENKKSEYVVLGTMISYGITIIFGLIIKHFLN